jgi:competence protein ComEC
MDIFKFIKKRYTATQRSFWMTLLAVGMVLAVYYIQSQRAEENLPDGEIRVCFIDIGQGDSILVYSHDNAVLIDGGEYSSRAKLLSFLKAAGIKSLDYVVATHPHSDHIGALSPVMLAYPVGGLLMPDATANTVAFEKLLSAAEDKNIPITVPSPGDVYTAGLINLTVLAPNSKYYESTNNYSIVLRMVFGETSFLFTGDAEWISEKEMLDSKVNLRANVLKAGHHGSSTSTTADFLDAVRPVAVVISCATGNDYGHPHRETLAKLADRNGIAVYRTDQLGDIIMDTDGQSIRLHQDE